MLPRRTAEVGRRPPRRRPGACSTLIFQGLLGGLLGGCFSDPPLNATLDSGAPIPPPKVPVTENRSQPSAVLLGVLRQHLVPLACFDAGSQQLLGGSACAALLPVGFTVLMDDGSIVQPGPKTQLGCAYVGPKQAATLVAWPLPPPSPSPSPSPSPVRSRFLAPTVEVRYGLWPPMAAPQVQLAPPPSHQHPSAVTSRMAAAGDLAPWPLQPREQDYYFKYAQRLHPERPASAFAAPVVEQSWRIDLDGDGARDQLTLVRIMALGKTADGHGALLVGVFMTPGQSPLLTRPLRLLSGKQGSGAPGPGCMTLIGALDLNGDHNQELWMRMDAAGAAEKTQPGPVEVFGRMRGGALETFAEIACATPP